MESKYYKSFEQFLKENPQASPDWEDFMEPVLDAEEDELFRFIMGFVL